MAMNKSVRNEIVDVIQFYEKRGLDWFMVVAFMCDRELKK